MLLLQRSKGGWVTPDDPLLLAVLDDACAGEGISQHLWRDLLIRPHAGAAGTSLDDEVNAARADAKDGPCGVALGLALPQGGCEACRQGERPPARSLAGEAVPHVEHSVRSDVEVNVHPPQRRGLVALQPAIEQGADQPGPARDMGSTDDRIGLVVAERLGEVRRSRWVGHQCGRVFRDQPTAVQEAEKPLDGAGLPPQ